MAHPTAQQRRRSILEQLYAAGEVSVDELAQRYDISEVTVRKDLTVLEEQGLLIRRYGGAIPKPNDRLGTLVTGTVSKRKSLLAHEAAGLIVDQNRIIIDSGRTTAALLPELSAKQGLVVMTNSLGIANALLDIDNPPKLLMTGGTWDPHSGTFQGQLAEHVLRAYDFDQLFIGADGIDLERGTTTFNELYSLSRVMADVAHEVIVMAESDKLGRKIHNLELPWSEVDVLVTDGHLPNEARRRIAEHGVRVIRAGEPDTDF